MTSGKSNADARAWKHGLAAGVTAISAGLFLTVFGAATAPGSPAESAGRVAPIVRDDYDCT
jgi:hypothetical protein